MLLEPIQKRRIQRIQSVLFNIHNSIEIVMHKTFRVWVSSNCNSAVPLLSNPCEWLIEEVIQRCLYGVIDIFEGKDIATRDVVDCQGSHFLVVGLALLVDAEGAAVDADHFAVAAAEVDAFVD